MTAGRRNILVTLQSYTTTQDEYGEEVQTWADLGEEYAAIYYGAGNERRQAAMEQGSQAATFEMESNTLARALTLKDRIMLGDVKWDITNIAPDTPQRGEIAVTAVRAA